MKLHPLARTALLVIAAIATLTASRARADVRLPAIFSDQMVIQRELPVKVWGWADAGEKVTVTLADKTATATADGEGRWSVTLEPVAADAAIEMTVAGNNTITLSDVLVGEVWVCSGQSNMQFSVSHANNARKEITTAKYPNIRLFTVKRTIAKDPQDDCQGTWVACSPQTVGGFSAVGYFFGRNLYKELNVPIGLIHSSWGGTQAESWTSNAGLRSDPMFEPILQRSATFNPNTPHQASVLFNGMIRPLIPLGIRGVIWYQGESNAGRAWQYKKLFPAMITDWRRAWGQGDFPFLFVQLAPFRYGKANPANCAELWEAQLQTLSLPNTGMAVTTDVGNARNIHPTNKQKVGHRLALWALAKTFGKDIVYSGPLYDSMAVQGNTIRITFQHVGGGLVAKNGSLTYFTIAAAPEAGAEPKFVPATATIDGETIVVKAEGVAHPAAVRFAWRDDAEPNLFNAEGLPASPFRTDDFPMVTEGAK